MTGNFKIDGITLKYADAEFTFYEIKQFEIDNRHLYEITLHSHKYYELHFIIKGQYRFSSIDKAVTVKSGEFIIIPPEYRHHPARPTHSYESIVIQFVLENKTAKKETFDYFNDSLHKFAFKKVTASAELLKNVKDFHKCCTECYGIEGLCLKRSLLSSLIYKLFYDINGFCVNGEKVKCSDSRSDFLVTLDSMITSNKYTIKDIAEKTGYSTRNISRLILSIYKMPLMELKRKNSIYTAKKLLETEQHTIEEVASLAGFKNAAAMRNAFRKYEGATPSLYKNLLDEKEDTQSEN